MKTVTEILGGAQTLLSLSFDIQRCFEEYLTEEHRCFIALLRVIEGAQPCIAMEVAKTGRPAYQNEPIMRAFLARNFFRIPTVTDLRNRLLNDPNLRKICDFDVVPSPATFSRRLKGFSEGPMMVQTLNTIVQEQYEGRIVGHISRDSTAIAARETPVNRKRDVVPVKPKRKRGRPRKGEVRPKKEPTSIEVQLTQSARKSLSKLPKSCAWGCKKNSQGNVSTWKGYKLHLDVSDIGFPITAIVTGANVHDSQAAIPMEKLTGRKVQHLYSLMDAAYDADAISTYISQQGRVPLIDPNKRRGPERIPFSPSQKQRFKIRTTVERANAHLKDWLIPTQIFVRGFEKVSFLLMCGVLCLAAIKALQYFILPEL
jgi:transposase